MLIRILLTILVSVVSATAAEPVEMTTTMDPQLPVSHNDLTGNVTVVERRTASPEHARSATQHHPTNGMSDELCRTTKMGMTRIKTTTQAMTAIQFQHRAAHAGVEGAEAKHQDPTAEIVGVEQAVAVAEAATNETNLEDLLTAPN